MYNVPLPDSIQSRINPNYNATEIIMDLGRGLEIRYGSKKVYEDGVIITEADINFVIHACGTFGADNRAGIDGTLHRISKVVSRNGETTGLTVRLGRAFNGCVDMLQDLVDSGESILCVGVPASGKTTRLRALAFYASTELDKAVVIVDTSNEIAGDGRIPHEAVGRSRRLQVPLSVPQYRVMIEAVENHAPEIVIVDEVGDEAEANACRTISQRGVQLIATAHGNCLEDVMRNPDIAQLLGEVKTATIGDAEMRLRGIKTKTVLEHVTPPCFGVVVEIRSYDEIAVHRNIPESMAALLKGQKVVPEIRRATPDGWDVTPGYIEVEEASSTFDEAANGVGYEPYRGGDERPTKRERNQQSRQWNPSRQEADQYMSRSRKKERFQKRNNKRKDR